MILGLTNLTASTIHIHPFLIPRTRLTQMPNLPAHKARRERVLAPLFLTIPRRVILRPAVITRLFPSSAVRRASFHFPTVPYRVSSASTAETRQLALPNASIRARRRRAVASAAASAATAPAPAPASAAARESPGAFAASVLRFHVLFVVVVFIVGVVVVVVRGASMNGASHVAAAAPWMRCAPRARDISSARVVEARRTRR